MVECHGEGLPEYFVSFMVYFLYLGTYTNRKKTFNYEKNGKRKEKGNETFVFS